MKNKKPLVFLVLMLLIGVVGGTFAFYSQSKSIDNKFVVGDFNVEIVVPDGYAEVINQPNDVTKLVIEDVKKITNSDRKEQIVDISNTENTDAIIRISYNEIFDEMSSDNPQYGVDESKYKVAYNIYYEENNSNCVIPTWTTEFTENFIYKDGWYYYKKILPAHNLITIMEDIVYLQDCTDQYEKYMLDFNLEAVQATPAAVKEIWGNEIIISESGDVDWDF